MSASTALRDLRNPPARSSSQNESKPSWNTLVSKGAIKLARDWDELDKIPARVRPCAIPPRTRVYPSDVAIEGCKAEAAIPLAARTSPTRAAASLRSKFDSIAPATSEVSVESPNIRHQFRRVSTSVEGGAGSGWLHSGGTSIFGLYNFCACAEMVTANERRTRTVFIAH